MSIPVRVGLTLTFLRVNIEFFDNIVSAIKKAQELKSDGIL